MAVTTKLPNGQYVLSYEGVGFGGWSQVHIKYSSDGTNWGSGPADLGTGRSDGPPAHMWARALTSCGVRPADRTGRW